MFLIVLLSMRQINIQVSISLGIYCYVHLLLEHGDMTTHAQPADSQSGAKNPKVVVWCCRESRDELCRHACMHFLGV